MTMPASDFNTPRGSFPTPIKPIGVGPLQGPLVQVEFNYQWCQVIVGSLSQLLLNTTWDVDTQAALTAIQEDVFDLMSAFCVNPLPAGPPVIAQVGADEDFMLRQNPDNPCELQTSVDGTNWCTWADLSKCMANVQQPGAGSAQPQPGGGCQEYDMFLDASKTWLVPTFFNDGDTIELLEITGASQDGSVDHWYCPDGSAFVLGACIGGTHTSSGDPMPAAPHMSLILNVGGVYFPLTAGIITTAGILVGQNATIQVNDSILSDNSGSIRAKVRVCNNQAATWSHTFNFADTDGGFVRVTGGGYGPRGTWKPGLYWDADYAVDGGGNGEHGMVLQRTGIPAFEVTSMAVTFDLTKGTTDTPSDYGMHLYTSDGTTPHDFIADAISAMSNGSNQLISAAGDHPGQTLIFMEFSDGNTSGGSDPGGTAHWLTLTITGKGTNPFA